MDFGNAVKSVTRSQMEEAVEAMPRVFDKLPTRAIVGIYVFFFYVYLVVLSLVALLDILFVDG